MGRSFFLFESAGPFWERWHLLQRNFVLWPNTIRMVVVIPVICVTRHLGKGLIPGKYRSIMVAF